MRQYTEAIKAFENSIAINPTFPTAHRNLSLLYYNKELQPVKALKALELAFSLDKKDARVLMELDQLIQKTELSTCKAIGNIKSTSITCYTKR